MGTKSHKQKLAIIGAGDMGQQLAHFSFLSSHLTPTCFFDDTKDKGETISHLPIVGGMEDIRTFFESKLFDCLLIGVGYNHMNFRAELYERFKGVIPFATLIHPSALIDPTTTIQEGSVIYPGCIIDAHTIIEPNVLLNLGCTISHHSIVGAHSFLSPSVSLAGFCQIGTRNILGIGTISIDHIHTASNIRTGGGTVLIKSLPESGTYVGNPARKIS